MIKQPIYQALGAAKTQLKKQFAVLIDPDKVNPEELERTIDLAQQAKVDLFFIGGSLIMNDQLDYCVKRIKAQCDIPVLLFPGNTYQIHPGADGILLLSLISGRNAELLIGKHVLAAPYLHKSRLEILPTGYMLIDGGTLTSVGYMSNTTPIPHHKDDIAVATALAGEMLGLKLIYMDAGSGAKKTISTSMINAVAKAIQVPLIVGGGIRTPQKAINMVHAGADIIVVGNAIEKDPSLIMEMAAAIHALDFEPQVNNGR